MATTTDMPLLRAEMAKKLNDIERVDLLLHEYKKLAHQAEFSDKTRILFKKWLLDKSYFLGSSYYDHDLIYEKMPELAKDKKFQYAYKHFVLNIHTQLSIPQASDRPKIKKNITILFNGSAGGGHKSPATALAQFFEKNGHNVQFIDIDTLIDRYSPRVKGYTRTELYSEVFQKEGDARKARLLRLSIDAQHKPEKRRYMADLKEMIYDFQADHIFAVAHHRPELSYVSYQLDVPMTYVHTDHVFNKHLLALVMEQTKLKKILIHFTALTADRIFLKTIYDAFAIKTKDLPLAIQRQLVRLDFPVRTSFFAATQKRINELREELKIPKDAVVCKLAMGQSGFATEMKDILKHLMEEQGKMGDKSLYVFVICGTNVPLKNALEKFVLKHLKKDSPIHIDIRGFMNEKEMSQIDQVSTVWITKPGGSTSAELVETQKQMLYVFAPHHYWEKTNADYLKKLHLAEPLSLEKSLVHQIKRRIEQYKKMNFSKLPHTQWQNQATHIINGGRSKYE